MMKTYRIGFLAALIGNVVLGIVLVGLWLHYRAVKPMAVSETKMANSTAKDSMADSMATPPASTEAPLVPVQISPQRLQSIGVKTGKVERKSVADEIRTTGSVAVDERRLAYVQVRFSGYIQKVFADATYQYVRKGQPLFTVYSPELVATEREYLVAKQNQQQVAQSTVQGVALSAASLLDAAAERLKQWGVPQKEITRLESTGQVQQELEVDSPVSGYITERNALPSVAVQPEMRAGNAPLHHRRPFHSLGSGTGLPERPRTYKDRRSRNAHGEYLSGPDVCWPCGLYLPAGGYGYPDRQGAGRLF